MMCYFRLLQTAQISSCQVLPVMADLPCMKMVSIQTNTKYLRSEQRKVVRAENGVMAH